MTRHLRSVLLAALAFGVTTFGLVLIGGHATAASPGARESPTMCGAPAEGKRADGTVWKGAAARMFVGTDGYWHVCQPWVPDGGDPRTPQPHDVPCLGEETPREWSDGDAVCSSLPPGAYTGMTDRLRPAADGRAQLLRDEWGPVQGMAIYRCTRGKWKLEGSFCKRSG